MFAAITLGAGPLWSQPADNGRPPASPPSPAALAPDEVWAQVAAAYRAAPVGERIRIGVLKPRPIPAEKFDPADHDPDRLALEEFMRGGRGAGFDEQRGVVFLRVAPGAALASGGEPATAPGPALRLEMGDLRVFAEPGRLIAARSSVPGGVVLRTFQGPVTLLELEKLMPPLLLPQLAMALGDPASQSSFLPGLARVRWESAQRGRELGRAVVLLRGVVNAAGSVRPIEVAVDESTHRLARVRLMPADHGAEPVQAVALEMFVSPIDPGEPASWRIETTGRIVVPSLDQLRSAPPVEPTAPANPPTPSAGIKPGDPLPQLYLFNARTEAWANEKSIPGRFAGVVPEDVTEFRIALLFFVPAREGARSGTALDALARMQGALAVVLAEAPAAPGDPPLLGAGVGLGELDRFDESRRLALRDWSRAPGEPPASGRARPGEIPILCSPVGAAMLQQLGGAAEKSGAAGPVIVIVDQSLTVLGVIGVASDSAAIAQDIRSAARPKGR